MFTPQQLVFLAKMVEMRRTIDGSFLEIGCAFGATTVFLAKYLEEIGGRQPYCAIDTFSGFVDRDIEHERRKYGRDEKLRSIFRRNDVEWFKASLQENGVTNVDVVQADATTIDYRDKAPIAFCLLDIDLYLPTMTVLPKVYDSLAPGGIIIVDDCEPDGWWGAHDAYAEFCKSLDRQPEIRHEKLGLLQKDSAG